MVMSINSDTKGFMEEYISGGQVVDEFSLVKHFELLDCADTYNYANKELSKQLDSPDAGVRERATRIFGILACKQGHATFPAAELFPDLSAKIIFDYIRNGNSAAERALATAPIECLAVNFGQKKFTQRLMECMTASIQTPEVAKAVAGRVGQWSNLRDFRMAQNTKYVQGATIAEYLKEQHGVDPDIYGKDAVDTLLQDLSPIKYGTPDYAHAIKVFPAAMKIATKEQKEHLYVQLLLPVAEPSASNPKPRALITRLFANGSVPEDVIRALPKEWLTREFMEASDYSNRILELRKEDIPLASVVPTSGNMRSVGYAYEPKPIPVTVPKKSRPTELHGVLNLETFAITAPDEPVLRLRETPAAYRALRDVFGDKETSIVFNRSESVLAAEFMMFEVESRRRTMGMFQRHGGLLGVPFG